jgi:hypothetical protein
MKREYNSKGTPSNAYKGCSARLQGFQNRMKKGSKKLS